MKPQTFQKALAFVLCLLLLTSASAYALAAKNQPKTAEELGYLPAEELLAEDGKTVKFNDPIVQKALEQQYPDLMEEDGSFLKDSLKNVDSLIIGVDVVQGDWSVFLNALDIASKTDDFIPEVSSIDLSVAQFCTKLSWIVVIAQKVESLPALAQSKAQYKSFTFAGVSDLNLEPCPSISSLAQVILLGCQVPSYEPLTKCKKLSYVELGGSDIYDISFVTKIPKLSSLSVANAPNADLTPLMDKKSFDSLSLDMTGAEASDFRWELAAKCKSYIDIFNPPNITPEIAEAYLSKLVSLGILYPERQAQANDISGLYSAKSLTSLYLSQANVEDLSFLADLAKLTDFRVYNSQIEDASGLFSAPKLQTLQLDACSVGTWGSPEVAAKKLSTISIESSGLTDLSFVSGLSLKLLWLNDNGVTDISPLTQAKKIEKLSLSNNPVTDFSPLAEIKGLKLVQHNSTQTLPELKKVSVVEGEDGMWAYQ